MIDEYGAFGGMRIGRKNSNASKKPAPVPLGLPQIPHDLTCTAFAWAYIANSTHKCREKLRAEFIITCTTVGELQHNYHEASVLAPT
jgi:hypothetical protein